MASMTPSEDEISQVIDFAGLNHVDDRDMAIIALKNNNRSVEAVVMQYFDNAESFRQKYTKVWDDNLFAGDRDGADNNAGISFHVESPGPNDVIQGVTPPPDNYGPGAPSRPPSRSKSRSPLGRMVDWTAADAPGIARGPQSRKDELTMPTGVPNSHAQEEEDMARALRESAQEAGITMPQQESGIMDQSSSNPYFGPTNRNDYDPASWAMVPTEKIETRFGETPSPSMRKRIDGAPAFLVQGYGAATSDRLGGLVTILHQIPMARNVLLGVGTPASSYGHNSEWWKGQEILPPHILAQLQSGELTWGEQSETKPRLDEEIHRLIAFLDMTERSYGSVSVLNDLLPYPGIGAERQFYDRIGDDNPEWVQPLFQVAAMAMVEGPCTGDEEARFSLLEIDHSREEWQNIATLYEAIDNVMWNDALSWNEINEESRMAMFKDMGEVFTLKIAGDGAPHPIEIPTELYPERWLTTRKEEAQKIQHAHCELKKSLDRLVKGEKEVYEWRDAWNTQAWDKRDLLRKAKELWSTYEEFLEGSARFRAMERSGFDTDKYPDYRAAPCEMGFVETKYHDKVEEVVQWTDDILRELDDRLKGFQLSLDQIRAKQRFLGQMLTVPDKPGRQKPMECKKFLLRGVITAPDITYVCSRKEPDLIVLDDPPNAGDQWWRLAYVPGAENPVQVEKVEIERVLRDTWQETNSPILVYATEAAVNATLVVPSNALMRFVKAENKAFRQELNSERGEGRRTGPIEPMSPSKRKHRSDSIDSMDSNRASLGSREDIGIEDPFGMPSESFATEMQDMSRNGSFDHGGDMQFTVGAGGSTTDAWPAGSISGATQQNSSYPTERTEDEQDEDDSHTATPDTESKTVEMQERARPITLMSPSQSQERIARGSSPSVMDMEIPDHEE